MKNTKDDENATESSFKALNLEGDGENDESVVVGIAEGNEDRQDGDNGNEEDFVDFNDENTQVVVDDCIVYFSGHQESVYVTKFFPRRHQNPGLVCSGGGDHCYVWDSISGDPAFSLLGHKDSIIDLSFSNDTSLIATGCMDGIIRFFSSHDGSLLSSFDGASEQVEWLEFNDQNPTLLFGSGDGCAWLLNTESLLSSSQNSTLTTTPLEVDCLQCFASHHDSVTCGAFSNHANRIITGCADGFVRVFDSESGRMLHKPTHATLTSPILSLRAHSTSSVFASGSQQGYINLFHSGIGQHLSLLNENKSQTAPTTDSIDFAVETLEFSTHASSPWLLAGSMDGICTVYDINTKRVRSRVSHKDGYGIIKASWHPANSFLFIAAFVDGSIRVYDTRVPGTEAVKDFKGNTSSVLDFDISNDAKYLISGSEDSSCRVFYL